MTSFVSIAPRFLITAVAYALPLPRPLFRLVGMSNSSKRRNRRARVEERHHDDVGVGERCCWTASAGTAVGNPGTGQTAALGYSYVPDTCRPDKRKQNLENKLARSTGVYEPKPFGNQRPWVAKACMGHLIILYYIISYYIILYYII